MLGEHSELYSDIWSIRRYVYYYAVSKYCEMSQLKSNILYKYTMSWNNPSIDAEKGKATTERQHNSPETVIFQRKIGSLMYMQDMLCFS